MVMAEELNFDDFSKMTVTLELEDDTTLECDVLLVFEENKRRYIAVVPTHQLESEEEADVYFYRLEGMTMDQLALNNIEDEEEYQDVAERFEEIMDEQEFSDMFTEE